ncbi:hypothetical protein Pelo_776 [Pelomyxa schiedti]|nr:hypothetical protein Pelo_776 [Pelomyxa schiedti]
MTTAFALIPLSTLPPQSIVQEGSLWSYAPWDGVCTARWVDGELWVGRDVYGSTYGTRIFKTTNGDGARLVRLNTTVSILWDNSGRLQASMPDISTITVMHGSQPYHFHRVGPVPLTIVQLPQVVLQPQQPPVTQPGAAVQEGSRWNYPPWGGICTARWVDGELWVGRDVYGSTSGTCIFKTRNGDGARLVGLHNTVNLLWDNTTQLPAFMPDLNTITVIHGSTPYHFTRQ